MFSIIHLMPPAPVRNECASGARSRTQAAYMLGGGAFLSLHDVELDGLAFRERLVTIALDGGMMHEAILLSIVARDEAKSFRVVEPLHGACRSHTLHSDTHCGAGRPTPVRACHCPHAGKPPIGSQSKQRGPLAL